MEWHEALHGDLSWQHHRFEIHMDQLDVLIRSRQTALDLRDRQERRSTERSVRVPFIETRTKSRYGESARRRHQPFRLDSA
jgi:hypothetical protein